MHNFIIHLPHCYFIRLISVITLTLSAIIQMLVCLSTMQAAEVRLPVWWFLITMSIITLEAVKFRIFLTLWNYLFYFSYIYIRERQKWFGIIVTVFLNILAASNCFFKSRIVRNANIFCHVSLSECVFLLDILNPTCSCLQGELFIFKISRWETNCWISRK
jgi:hypothetical protein